MRNLFKKATAMALTLTMVAGLTGVASAAVKKGTDVTETGSKWTSYSIYTQDDCKGKKEEWAGGKEDNCWYHNLTNNDTVTLIQHYVDDKVTDAQIKAINEAIKEDNKTREIKKPTISKHEDTWGAQDAFKCFGENAKITEKTPSSFLMDVVSTGWSAKWGPTAERDEYGDAIYEAKESNPWGVDAKRTVNVERGRYYTISFKIKSTLQNVITTTEKRKDGTGYNVPTKKTNTVKHIHFKAYDNKDPDGRALTLLNLKAKQGSKNVLVKGDKVLNDKFESFVTLDSSDTTNDGWVNVSAKVLIPSEKEDWQGKAKQPTLGIQFAFGAFIYEFPDENDMSGTIEVKDFKVTAGEMAKKPGKVKKLKVTAQKKAMVVNFKKASKAKKYEIQYSLKSNFKKATTKTTKKTSVTIKKLKSKKKYYVRVRGIYTSKGSKICGKWVKKTVKIK